MATKESKNKSKPSSATKKKRITINAFTKKFILGITLCTISATIGAGIAYGITMTSKISNDNTLTNRSVSLYNDNGSPVNMTIGTSIDSKTFSVPESSLPNLNNYVNSNSKYLTLSLVFPVLEFNFTNKTTINKDNISFNLVLISNVINSPPTTLKFNLNHDIIDIPSGGTLSFTNLVFDFKVSIANDGTISLTKTNVENPTLKVSKIKIK